MNPRRTFLRASTWALAAPAWAPRTAQADNAETVVQALRQGGCVMAFRHALAPGTFDPPQFKLGDCSTQRNLSDEGRAQARRIGDWFAQHALAPVAVRSSPWCRCIDTATLAFGGTSTWAALGSPAGAPAGTSEHNLQLLKTALQRVRARQFEVWVTHMFVLSDLAQSPTAPGEALLLRSREGGQPEVLARLVVV